MEIDEGKLGGGAGQERAPRRLARPARGTREGTQLVCMMLGHTGRFAILARFHRLSSTHGSGTPEAPSAIRGHLQGTKQAHAWSRSQPHDRRRTLARAMSARADFCNVF